MKRDMTTGTEWKALLWFSLPIMGSNFLQFLYNLADSIIVGKFVNSTAFGAVGTTSALIWLVVSACTGLGAGTSIAVSQYFGSRDEQKIKETVSSVFLLSTGLGILMTGILILLARPILLLLLQTPENMLPYSTSYFVIYCLGILFQLIYNVTCGILRAHGDSGGALLFLFISAVLNVALDCLFVIVFHWGVAGAAAATVIAQFACACAAVLYMKKLFPDLMPSKKHLTQWKPRCATVIHLSIPIMLQSMVTALGFLVLQRLVNSFGENSIEGYAAMQKIEQISHIPSISLNVAISSFVGQNIGARKLERVRKGYRSAIIMGVASTIVISVFVLIFDQQLLSLFNITGESMRRGREHLDLLMLFIWVSTITNITTGFLQGAGDVKVPAASGFVNLGIRLILSYVLAGTAVGFRCFYVSMPPAWLITSLFVVWRYRSGKWENYSLV